MHKSLVLLGLATAILLQYLGRSPTEEAAILDDIDVPDVFQASLKERRPPEVVKVSDNVYVAVGYSFASVTMIVGVDGVIIVDTSESMAAANRIQEVFRRITDKPTKLIIYTHHHQDHVMGAKAFVTSGAPAPEVWAHERMEKEESLAFPVSDIRMKRAAYQFGTFIEEKYRFQLFSSGSGPTDAFGGGCGKLPPTKLVRGDFNVTLAGVHFWILHIPGETSDHIGVWLPESRILIAGDNLYKSFPNLYPIRGTSPRDVTDWIRSLGKMIELRPRHLISGHDRPISGEREIGAILVDYKSAVQFVHDQTVRRINEGLHPDEIAKTVRLHEDYKDDPYLREVYGTVPWSVRGIYDMYLGWFSGSVRDLHPLTPRERAERMVALVGGDRLLSAAESALRNGDHQWALELASHPFVAGDSKRRAAALRRGATRGLAGRMTSGGGRNYLMTAILADSGELAGFPSKALRLDAPAPALLARLRYRVNAEAVPVGEQITGCFVFADGPKPVCLHLYKSVLNLIAPASGDPDFEVYLTDSAFRQAIGNLSAASSSGAFRRDGITIKGDPRKLEKLLSYLDLE